MESLCAGGKLRLSMKLGGASLLVLCLAPSLAGAIGQETLAAEMSRLPLPEPVVDPHSIEICMNSRISYHGGWSASGTEQMMADVLHATAKAPVTGGRRTIYLANSQNVYIYDADSHSLIVHKAGNWKSDASAAFEVGVAAENTVDAGAAMHLAQLESIAIWTGTSNQLASCPRATATTYANSNWNPIDPVDIVVSFGIRSVPGFKDAFVAHSSDGSLPDPDTDGAVFLDSVLVGLAYDSTFATSDLSLNQISQLLWAAYGCSDHWAVGSKAGLVCSSAVANYYLTRRIYSAGADGVYRYHNRRPPGTDATTRDHRIEMVTADDARPGLRLAVPRLPDAPHYVILCTGSAGAWQELEVGFAAVGALLEASGMDLQGYFTTGFSAQEQADIREATGIPVNDLPIAVVSLGPPSDVSAVDERGETVDGLRLSINNRLASGEDVVMRYTLPIDTAVDLTVYDCLGRMVRSLVDAAEVRGAYSVVWDCRDEQGRFVLSGVYFCRLRAGNLTREAQVVVIR